MHEVLLSSISFQVILNLYGSESGREINTEKLEILFSVNTPIAIKRTIGNTFGIYRSSHSIRYLGTTLSLQRRNSEDVSLLSQTLRKKKKKTCWVESKLPVSFNPPALSKPNQVRPMSHARKVLPSTSHAETPLNCFRLPITISQNYTGCCITIDPYHWSTSNLTQFPMGLTS